MGTWVEQVHGRAGVLLDQMLAWQSAQAQAQVDISPAIARLRKMIEDLYAEEMPLARILDSSDLVMHAEGPSTATTTPGLHAFNWLCTAAEKQIRILAKSIFDLSDINSKLFAKKLDLRFSGFAPGSIYAGFSLSPISSILGSDEPEVVFETLRMAIRQLPTIPEFIDDEKVSAGISELMPDPALRDASLEAVFRLSPTGRAGIHTIDISSPDAKRNALTNRDRVVLREALLKPMTKTKRFGKFVGEIRAIDLDSSRVLLRSVESIGSLRCVIPETTGESAKSLLGSLVCIEGEYEVDASGRPRLMFAQNIWPAEKMVQQSL
ncbi:hypothetical protein [Pseudomonas monteilii]|uniref:hypothetical protein n=1 Tax=Pseudomonas monteilii TaxID=76759 RepID=UPI0018A34F96|nr:hypothetical protein [Pseudomonas monteilii]BBV97944.1 hypothetical protein STW0522PSE72_32950 [Pseudomonas monteilii]